MKIRSLLMTTILSTGILLNYTSPSYAADITKNTVDTANSPISKDAINDPSVAISGFLEHINYARVALAMNNADLAKQHITQARNMAMIIKNATTQQRQVTRLESGRIVYLYDTEYKYHYFPIQTGPMKVKTMSNGPIWAKNELAVTDADVVYLTIDLNGDKTDKFLDDADTAITADNLKEADNQLAKLTDSVVTVDVKISDPIEKVQDNISLAREFIAGGNYDGASYALKHADRALDEMHKNDIYKGHIKEIVSMRKDVSDLQGYITKKDPTMIQKANAKLEKWLKELKSWSKSKK